MICMFFEMHLVIYIGGGKRTNVQKSSPISSQTPSVSMHNLSKMQLTIAGLSHFSISVMVSNFISMPGAYQREENATSPAQHAYTLKNWPCPPSNCGAGGGGPVPDLRLRSRSSSPGGSAASSVLTLLLNLPSIPLNQVSLPASFSSQ